MARRHEMKLGKMKKEGVAIASQWMLIRWKFFRHKLALFGMVVLGVMYLLAIFAEFVSPYDPTQTNKDYKYCPPHRIHFVDTSGRFHLRPFVYGMEGYKNPETWIWEYSEKTEVKHPIFLFVKSEPYKVWGGLFSGNTHLFGTREGKIFLLGTDTMGRDMLSRIIFGGRVSLSIGLLGVAISFVLGMLFGGISGYFGGVADVIIQRIIEFLMSIPSLPLWMALSVALPRHWPMIKVYFGIVLVLSFTSWTGVARVVRGKFLALREEDFVMAAELHGARKPRIIFAHILPSFYSHIIASLTLSIPGMILGETALSFIGLGLQAPAISWGVLLNNAQSIKVLSSASWLMIPGLFIIVVILAFNFVGDGMRDAADPYSKV